MSSATTPLLDQAGSLDLVSLTNAYRTGQVGPSDIVTAVLGRIEAAGDDGVWISKVSPEDMRARARNLEAMDQAKRQARPLWGIPFAVKDNIDVAGLPTTAGCPDFAYVAERNATVVDNLLAAGAILVGKTNLDQFATGLVGVRSPYGIARNPFNADYIPGGSSSGSAVAVSSGLVSFALGTDTAGSGRVPAGFNNIVGLKPSKGLISTAGVVPACRSLDCVSIFALTVADSMVVLNVAAAPDTADPYSRPAPPAAPALSVPIRIGVPHRAQLSFFGDSQAEALHDQALARLEKLGAHLVPIDFSPFSEAAALLYQGAWVAERTAAVGDFIRARPDAVLPVTKGIIMGGDQKSAVEAFRAAYRLEELRAVTMVTWAQVDAMALPTSGTIYKIAEVLADPVATNSNLGAYTNFANLLDLCGIAVPAGFREDGMPAGITLIAPAFRENALSRLATAFHRDTGLTMGASRVPQPPETGAASYRSPDLLRLLVVGGHLSGQPLNHQLTDRGAAKVATCRTAASYRLFALPGEPARPGMIRVAGNGASIEGEIWEMTPQDFGQFLAAIPAPLGVGTVELEDGGRVCGFLCETAGLTGARDITSFGGWRAWRASLKAG
jgi:allophanate hydrolase